MKLNLYLTTTCPFCIKVLTFLEEEGLSVPLINLSTQPEKRGDLIELGGISQVPCLDIEGTALYESDDIIDWFIKHKEKVKNIT